MNRPAILIIGAGATGLPVGYHLGLAGADVTYLVRPGRKAAYKSPQQLYSYDDASLKTFAGYHVVDEVTDLAGTRFQFVLITLDGHACRTEEGTAMLRALGDAIRDTDAIVIMSGFGHGVREHHLRTLRIPENRLLHGFLGMLSHQAAANLPVHPPTDPTQVAQATVCYRHPKNRVGFRVETGNPAASARFAALYNRSGVSRCVRMSRPMDNIYNTIGFPVYAACELADYADFTTIAADKELWQLACRAQREIMTLPENGWRARLLAVVMGPRATRMVHVKSERDMLPLDYQAFNRFHHGGKVRAQDIASMHSSIDEGRRQGRPMKALQTLLARLEAHQAAAHVAS